MFGRRAAEGVRMPEKGQHAVVASSGSRRAVGAQLAWGWCSGRREKLRLQALDPACTHSCLAASMCTLCATGMAALRGAC